MEPLSSPSPRRVGRPSWLDLRLVLGVVLVLAAVLIGAKVIADARSSTSELALTRDLAAGTKLRADDLTAVDATVPDSGTIYLSDKSKAVGKVLSQAVSKGELLPAGAVQVAGGGPLTTVIVPFESDASPTLTRGQRIVVWLSTAACPSVVLLPDVTVQDVNAADDATFANGGTGQDVVISVSPELADRVSVALAIDGSTIRAGVLTGDVQAGGSLASLAGCAKTQS